MMQEEIKALAGKGNKEYALSGGFDTDNLRTSKDARFKTGFEPLDLIQPFYSGLYIIGAVPSLGKTTWAQQLADSVAASGRHVLFYSLEQSQHELFSKSISRTMLEMCCEAGFLPGEKGAPDCFSATEIRTVFGRNHQVAKAVDRYVSAIGDRLTTISPCFPYKPTAMDIFKDVADWSERNPGERPLVIVDYLQILRAPQIGMSDKEAVDDAITTLKGLQEASGCTVLIISSLNRANYMLPIDFTSYKESGGIEYGADVIWGLQLACVTDPEFTVKLKGPGNEAQKRLIYDFAKRLPVRSVQLKCLKNRNGDLGYSCDFKYYPKYDSFTWMDGAPWWDFGSDIKLPTKLDGTVMSPEEADAKNNGDATTFARLVARFKCESEDDE